MSLQSPPVTELTVEPALARLFNEWLKQWFDGQAHVFGVNGPVVTFPKANRAFGQSPAMQPMHTWDDKSTDAEIRLTVHSRAELVLSADTSLYQGKLTTDYVTFHFWVSAKKPGEGQSEYLARDIATKLSALLRNPDTRYDLAERGVGHLQLQGMPQSMPDALYHKRLVACTGQVTYAVEFSGDGAVTEPPAGVTIGNTQTIQFRREAILLENDYLEGYYRWTSLVQVVSAVAVGWASQGGPVVLGLEVNGVMTGATVTLPPGDPNTEVNGTVQGLAGLAIPAGQAVRWRVMSAPVPEASAWHVTLAMDVTGG